ncbi:MAG: MFS transporter [Bacillota bacterium]
MKSYWQRLVGLFFTGWLLIYANRLVLSASMKAIQEEWHLSKTALGLMTSAFFVTYSAMQVPAGYLGDRFSRKLVLAAGYFIHALGAILSGLATNPHLFVLVRALTGLGQGTYYSNEYAIAGAEIPDRHRAAGMAVINSGMSAGIIIGLLAGGFGSTQGGTSWRVPFVVLGVATLGLAVLMWLVIRGEPAKEQHEGDSSDPTDGGLDFKGSMACYGLAFISMYGFYLLLTWLPFYLQESRGFSPAPGALTCSIVPLLSIPFSVYGGLLSDRIGSRRRILIVLLPVSAVCFFLISLPQNAWLILGLVLYGVTGKLVVDPLIVAYMADAVPKSRYATAFGVLNFASALGTVASPAITGRMADLFGNFTAAFYLAMALQVLAWGFAWLLPEVGRSRGQA